ncbi:MAG: PEP-CTERM sorting domain-containing protein [Sphingomonadales bacterium]|nr:PEP-CTERM sorting domain-containing protein [Sphingomonadales bacterium]
MNAAIGKLNWIEIRFDDQEPSYAVGVQPNKGRIDAASPLTNSPSRSVANTSAIPEPKIWALLLLGLGAAGLSLRRRQKASSFV